jgi:hypothetical protein
MRHVSGYAAFAAFAADQGLDPMLLASDLPAMLEFAASHRAALEDPLLCAAAVVFFGNAVVVAHPRAEWRAMPDDPEVGTETQSVPVRTAFERLLEHPESRHAFLSGFADWAKADEDHDEVARIRHEPTGPLRSPERAFALPPVVDPVFLDDDERPIRYGSRWPDGPPEEAYSRVSHPERFTPLRDVVAALSVYLEAEFEVHTTRTDEGVRLVPEAGASLRLDVDRDGIVRMRAGELVDQYFPDCGCDACDETASGQAHVLVDHVLSIAGGGLVERWPIGHGAVALQRFQLPGGGWTSSSAAAADRFPPGEAARVGAALAALPHGTWPAWPLRAADR